MSRPDTVTTEAREEEVCARTWGVLDWRAGSTAKTATR